MDQIFKHCYTTFPFIFGWIKISQSFCWKLQTHRHSSNPLKTGLSVLFLQKTCDSIKMSKRGNVLFLDPLKTHFTKPIQLLFIILRLQQSSLRLYYFLISVACSTVSSTIFICLSYFHCKLYIKYNFKHLNCNYTISYVKIFIFN